MTGLFLVVCSFMSDLAKLETQYYYLLILLYIYLFIACSIFQLSVLASYFMYIVLRYDVKGVCQSATGGADTDTGGNGVWRQHVLRKRTVSESVDKSE